MNLQIFFRDRKLKTKTIFQLSDVVHDEIGATNFITGAGGFLQLIFNGFFGVRIHPKHLEIRNPRLPGNYTAFQLKGMCYLNSKFKIDISAEKTFVTFHQLGDELKIQLEGKQWTSVEENMPCMLYNVA